MRVAALAASEELTQPIRSFFGTEPNKSHELVAGGYAGEGIPDPGRLVAACSTEVNSASTTGLPKDDTRE